MKKHKYIGIFLVLTIMTSLLALQVIGLAGNKKDNLETIAKLNRQVSQLQTSITKYKEINEQEKKDRDLLAFKQSAFKLRHPKFTEIAEVVFRKSQEYGFNPYLVMAVIQVESGFDQYAVSTAGAYGLMQVNYTVWKNELSINFNRIFEKEYNIDLGLRVLKHYYDRNSGNMHMALYRYNNGYKYHNHKYNGRIVATKFYAHQDRHRDTTPTPAQPEKKVSI